ncbi:rho guanine nucleotide exchange factor 7-like [Babylonia areolata]|uniref:rho guanine nucleotide exchange factor 7-like n=1 Tax=Babylonia areolata TaxID=304850 RepID=UPI003FD26442
MARVESSEYPDDYIEIVNEINDFIASLDGVPGEGNSHPFSAVGGCGGGGGVSSSNNPSSYSDLGSGSYAGVGSCGGGGGGGGGGSSGSSDAGYGGSSSTGGATSRGPSDFLSPYQLGAPLSDSRFSVDSLEHDYEPIENIVVATPPPTPPRNPTPVFRKPSFAASSSSSSSSSGGGGGCHSPLKMADGQPKHVKAIFNFKGTNNDELCFSKGDIVTVTQVLDGGWWEGTLNGKTGWFPSNYVKEVKAGLIPGMLFGQILLTDDIIPKNTKDMPVYKRESMQLYHNVVLKNVIETERMHVSEMTEVLQNYFRPIQGKAILSPAEFTLLIGNLEEIISFQQTFLAALEDCEKLPLAQRRVGGLFMQFAPRLKELYLTYCANHPRAVSVLQSHREELRQCVETLGTPQAGTANQNLTTYLSKPFTRLDRYPSLLKELERHIEESHPDRGDTQRAIVVYRDIANSCMEIRKRKEMEYEILTSNIRGWEGEEIQQLGEVTHLSQVKVHTQTGEKYERIFVLFSNSLVMLSMSPRLSSYQYEGKLPLSGMAVSKCEESDKYPNGFEISGPMIDKLVVTCGTKMEVAAWLEVLRNVTSGKPAPNPVSVKPQSLQISSSQPSISTITQAKTAQVSHTVALPTPPRPTSVWSFTCLRPAPPLRPSLMCREDPLRSPRSARRSTQRKKPVRTFSGDETEWQRMTYNEDAFILQVIEAYCNSTKTRHTVNSCKVLLDPKLKVMVGLPKIKTPGAKDVLNHPSLLVPEDEKILNPDDLEEKTLVDTVYSLKDKVRQLEQEQRRLRQDLDEERRARVQLESAFRHTTAAASARFPASAAAGAAIDVARDNTPPT